MRRRTFLAVMGAGTLTGCNALGGKKFDKRAPGEAFSNVKTASGLGKGDAGKSARATLGKGEYANFGFKLKERSEMKITGQVMKNGPIDLYIMTVNQFNQFQRKPNLIPSEAAAEGIESIDFKKPFGSGDYLLVFDNTYLGQTSPSGEIEVEFEFVLTGMGNDQNNTTTQSS